MNNREMPPIPTAGAEAPAMPPLPDGVKPAASLAEQEAALEMPAPPPLVVQNARPNTAPIPPSNTAKVPDVAPIGGHRPVEVIATRNGFYKQRRINEGAKFTVPSMAHVGSWMKCVDPVLEKENRKTQEQKRKAAGKQ